MKLNNLEDLLHHELQDLYSAEKQMLKALPRMTRAASHGELKAAFRANLRQTELHALRLNKIAYKMDVHLGHHKCRGMEGLLDEAAEIIAEESDENVLDAALISAAQRIEHYQIAAYGTAMSLASKLGMQEAAALLEDTLHEEQKADARLTGIAVCTVNGDALAVQSHTKYGVRMRPPQWVVVCCCSWLVGFFAAPRDGLSSCEGERTNSA